MNLLSPFSENLSGPGGARTLESPYCKIVIRDHPETIVSFSPINCPPGKFTTSRIFARVPQNVVFLNCPRNAWFLDGIPGLGDSIEESALCLQEILDQLGIGRTRKLYWGGSMGGFGAVVFGAVANAELVVATGAELALLVAGGNSELVLKKCQGRTGFPEIPIESWIRRSQTQFHLYSGEFAYYDLISALPFLDHPRVQVSTLRDFGHALPGYLEEVYGLYPFLNAQFSTLQLFKFKQGESGLLSRYSDWWHDLQAVSMNLPGGSESRLLAGLRGTAGLPPEVAGHCGNALSRAASLRGDHQAAVNFAREALQVSGPGRYLSYRLVQAMHAAGKPPPAWLAIAREIEDLSRAARLDFGDQLVEMIAKGYTDSADVKGAAKFISNQRKLSKAQPKRVALLDRLAGISENSATWTIGFTRQSTAVFSRHGLDRSEITGQNRQFTISGTLLAESPDDQITEVSMRREDGSIHQFFMNHPSPGVANLRPDLPHASRVRFKIDLQLSSKAMNTVVLSAKTASGALIDWLVMTKKS